MRVLIADRLARIAISRLKEAGHEVVEEPGVSGEALSVALKEHDPAVLIVRSTKTEQEQLEVAESLELIVRAGAGVDTIDISEASRRGVFVANCPGKNASAVAELTMGLIIAMDRRIPENVAEARAGRWDKKRFASAQGLRGRTLGLIGLGNIGRGVAERARGFGMKVVAWSRSLTPETAAELNVEHAGSPIEVAERADIVSLHVASTPDTKHLVDADFLAAMKSGAQLINTTRAPVVDEEAVLHAIDDKGICFATDVPSGEPPSKQAPFEDPLAAHPNVYITHHIGASTKQATEATGLEAARVILEYEATGRVANSINLADHSPATHLLTVRHLDRVGVLARVLDVVRKAELNVQEMENLIFEGAEAACARIRFDGPMDEGVLADIQAVPDVLHATVLPL